MRAKTPGTMEEGDLFHAKLDQIVNLNPELVQLDGKIKLDRSRDRTAPQRES